MITRWHQIEKVFNDAIDVPASDRDAAIRAEITSGIKETGDKGFFALINRPGLGIEVNEKALDASSEEHI